MEEAERKDESVKDLKEQFVELKSKLEEKNALLKLKEKEHNAAINKYSTQMETNALLINTLRQKLED